MKERALQSGYSASTTNAMLLEFGAQLRTRGPLSAAAGGQWQGPCLHSTQPRDTRRGHRAAAWGAASCASCLGNDSVGAQLPTSLQLNKFGSKGPPVSRLPGTRLFVGWAGAVPARRELPGEPRGRQDSALPAALRHSRVNNRFGRSL